MKKLLSVLMLFSSSLLSASTADDLGKAIVEVNVEKVRSILAYQPLTQQDKRYFMVLTEEVVFNRELWTRKLEVFDDVSTPYTFAREKVSVGNAIASGVGGALIAVGFCVINDCRLENHEIYGIGTVGLGVSLIFIQMLSALVKMDKKQREILRKKYEDALTIQQLIYTAAVIEA